MNYLGTVHRHPKKQTLVHFALSMILSQMMEGMLLINCRFSHPRFEYMNVMLCLNGDVLSFEASCKKHVMV